MAASKTLASKYHPVVYDVCKKSVDTRLASTLEYFGSTQMSDGATVLNSPIMNYMVGMPNNVFFDSCTDISEFKISDRASIPTAYSRYIAEQHVQIEARLCAALPEPVTVRRCTYLLLQDGAMRCAGRYWEEAVPYSNFAVCFPHSMDKIFADIGKLDWVAAEIDNTRKISNFVYAHQVSLALFKVSCPPGISALVRSSGTRFAGEFYAMESQKDRDEALKKMVAAPKWSTWLAKQDYRELGEEVTALINSPGRIRIRDGIIKMMVPAVKALRLGDSDSSAIGLVYNTMAELSPSLKKEFDDSLGSLTASNFPRKVARWEEVSKIVADRWEYLHAPIHAAAYAVNPLFIDQDFEAHNVQDDDDTATNEILDGFEHCLARFYYDDSDSLTKAMRQFTQYRSVIGPVRTNETMTAYALACGTRTEGQPYTPWGFWETYGDRKIGPQLTKFAKKILSCQSGVGACERGHKKTKLFLTKLRNRQGVEKASEQIYVAHNQPRLDVLDAMYPYCVEVDAEVIDCEPPEPPDEVAPPPTEDAAQLGV